MVIIINREKQLSTGDIYLTFKLLKRRYRSSDNDDTLRELEYFNHPYEKGSSIRLVHDLEMDTAVSLTSLSTTFVAADNETKRGKRNAIEREDVDDKKKKKNDDDFGFDMDLGPFDFGKHSY